MNSPYIIERAFDLARSGAFANVSDIAKQLRREGYASVDAHLAGTLKRQLRELCALNRLARFNEGPLVRLSDPHSSNE